MCPRSNYIDLLNRWLEAKRIWPGLHVLVPEPEPPKEITPLEAEQIKRKAEFEQQRAG